VRVSFRVVRPAAASVVAAAMSGVLSTYHTRNGDLALVEYATKPAAAMFQSARQANSNLTWLLRLGGLLVLFIGIRALLGPLHVFADVAPVFRRIARVV